MLKTLSHIGEKLNKEGIRWAVGGSVLLSQYGLIEAPHDIDIIIDIEDIARADALLESLGKKSTWEKNANYATKFFYEYSILGSDVDVMAGLTIICNDTPFEYPFDDHAISESRLINQVTIPCMALEEWFYLYQLIPNRGAKVDLIEAYLLKNGLRFRGLLERALDYVLPDTIKMRILKVLIHSNQRLFLPKLVQPLYTHFKIDANAFQNGVFFYKAIDKASRKLLLKRGQKATHYFDYCEEVGCDVWDTLLRVKEALGEPMGLWLPEQFILEGTSKYVQGVEVPANYEGVLPEGFDLIDLPPCKYLIFQGTPYEDDRFQEAISCFWQALESFDPSLYGFKWAPEAAPRFQLEPQGHRGYMEGLAIENR